MKTLKLGALAIFVAASSGCFGTSAEVSTGPTAPSISRTYPYSSLDTEDTITLEITGLSSPGTVYVYGDGNCSANALGFQTDIPAGAIGLALQLRITSPGSFQFSAKASNNGGMSNCSAPPAQYTLLGQPSLPALPVPASITVTSPSGGQGYVANPYVVVTGLQSGLKVNLYTESTCTNQVASTNAYSTSVPFYDSDWTTPLTVGPHTLYADTTNSSNQHSACSSASATYTVLAPPVPSSLTITSPTSPGTSSRPSLDVGGVSNGVTVNLYSDSSCTTKVASTSSYGSTAYISSGAWASPLNFGNYTFYANTSSGSSYSACSTASASYTYSLPPVPTSLTLINPSASPGTYTKPTIEVGGVGQELTVSLFTNSTCTAKVASTTAYGATVSFWSAYWTTALTVGSYVLYAQTNAGATYSACSTANVAYTLIPLAPPSSLTLVTPASSPHYLQSPTLSVGGTLPGQTVQIFSDASCTTQVGSGSGSSGSTQVTLSAILPTGTSTLFANLSDSNGGASSCSTSSVSYTVTPRVQFQNYVRYTTGHSPQKIVAADFNADNKLDLVTANHQNGNSGKFFGNGDSTFGSDSAVSLGAYAQTVVTGDLNSDSKPDLVFADFSSCNVYILLGQGNGSFAPKTTFSTSLGTSCWAETLGLSDLNGDGNLDLVIGHFWVSRVVVALGNGDGTFKTPVAYATANDSQGLVLGDVNGDAKIDIVSAGYGTASILLGNGDGTFQSKVDLTISGYAMTLRDLNGDGSLDLLSASSSGLSTYMNDGSGSFTLKSTTSDMAGNSYNSVSAADIDGDGWADAVVTSYSQNRVLIFFGKGDGTVDLPQILPTYGSTQTTLIQDLDGDGDLDIVVGTDQSISVLKHL